MTIEKYNTKSTVSGLVYTFESIGVRTIKKMVIYSKINNPEYFGLPAETDVYNLGFGDYDEETGGIDDKIESKNGDTEKVLATVANTANEFWQEYPDALLYFQGSQVSDEMSRRTRLHQMRLNLYMNEINKIAYVFGLFENRWEALITNKNYYAFLILRKD